MLSNLTSVVSNFLIELFSLSKNKIRFETGDGIKREETGAQKKIGEEFGATSQGTISWKTPDGKTVIQRSSIIHSFYSNINYFLFLFFKMY
jgi:hypothetical protein